MALINCPSCGKEVSDRATFCTQCGFRLSPAKVNGESEIEKRLCEDCGEELFEGIETCPNCGCPVPVPDKEPKIEDIKPQQVELTKITIPLFKKKAFWFSIIGCIILVIGLLVSIKVYHNRQAETYYENMEILSFSMLNSASEAEKAGNLIHAVWYNAIFDKYDPETIKYTTGASDFNDALKNLFSDDDFKKQIDNIKKNQNTVNSLMKTLKNPPKEYQEAYEDLRTYYDAYIEFTDLVINPTGSLQSYTNDFNNLDSKTVNCYRTMQLHLGK